MPAGTVSASWRSRDSLALSCAVVSARRRRERKSTLRAYGDLERPLARTPHSGSAVRRPKQHLSLLSLNRQRGRTTVRRESGIAVGVVVVLGFSSLAAAEATASSAPVLTCATVGEGAHGPAVTTIQTL